MRALCFVGVVVSPHGKDTKTPANCHGERVDLNVEIRVESRIFSGLILQPSNVEKNEIMTNA